MKKWKECLLNMQMTQKLDEFVNILEDRNNVQTVIYKLANRPKVENDV